MCDVFLGGGMDRKSRLRQGSIPAKPRFRSVPDAAVLNSQLRFLRNCSLSASVFQGASFGIFPCLKLVFRCGWV